MFAPQDSTGRPASFPFREDIEGLRGLAVLLVVLYHAGLPVPGGFIGVDVFFVISGYLITGLLISERSRTGRIDLVGFYARRVRRLLPAVTLTIVAVLLAGALVLSPIEQAASARSAFYASLYSANIHFISQSGGYFGRTLEFNPFLHVWSLAAEEQFYFVWPALIALFFTGIKPGRRLLAAIGLISVVSFAGSIWYTRHSPAAAFFGSPLRAWEFGLGSVMSLIPAAALDRHKTARNVAGGVGLALLLVCAATITPDMGFPGAIALVPVAASCLAVVANPDRETLIGHLLRNKVMTNLGRLSYSWYLWHWPFLVLGASFFLDISPLGKFGLAAASLLMAAATHTVVENKVRFNASLVANPLGTLVLGLSLTLTVALVSVGAAYLADSEIESGTHSSFARASQDNPGESSCITRNERETSLPPSYPSYCTTERTGPGTLVAVFGDSHAEAWLPAVTSLAKQQDWRVQVHTKGGCPSAIVDVQSLALGSDFNEVCIRWRQESLRRIMESHPDVVIISNSREHVTGPNRKDKRQRAEPDTWRMGIVALLTPFDSAGIPVLLIQDIPRSVIDVPLCLSRAQKQRKWHSLDCNTARSHAEDPVVANAVRQAARGFGHVSVFDPADYFCNSALCPPMIDGIVVLRDSDHMTADFSVRLSGALLGKLAPLIERQ